MADKDPKTQAPDAEGEALDTSELEGAVGGTGGEHDTHSFGESGNHEMPSWYSGGE